MLLLAFKGRKELADDYQQVNDTIAFSCLFQINNIKSGVIPLPRQVFDSLTLNIAHELVRHDPKYQKYCQGHSFKAVQFGHEPGFQAFINFITDKKAAAK